MVANQAERPQFFEGQYLGAADLAAVVEHARFQHARHDLGAHTWGIAAGLQLREQTPAGGQLDIYILPGYAWDGFGRPIVVLAPYKLPAELFKPAVFDPAIDDGEPAGRLIEVWLRYEEVPTQSPRRGFEVCDPDAPFARVQETFRVEVGRRPGLAERQDQIAAGGYTLYAQEALQTFDPQTPATVLHDESVAFQHLPAAGERRRWLIPLGVVRWRPNPDASQPGNFVGRAQDDLGLSRSLRRYIGVVAGAVQAADKNIRLRDRTRPYSTVRSDDLVWAEGNVRVEGDVRLFRGKLEWRDEIGQGEQLDMRRATETLTGTTPPKTATMLQAVIGEGNSGVNRFAVGPLKAGETAEDPKVVDEKFVVLDNGNVGVGTTAPITALHLPDRGLQIGTSTTVADNFHIVSDLNGGPRALRIYNGNYGSGTHLLSVLSNGNVGLGTPDPGAPLHVASHMVVGPFAATGGVGGIDVTGPVAELGFVRRTLSAWPSPAAPGDRFVWYNPDGSARLWTNSSDLLTVTSTGHVGIGTTAPVSTLQLNGDVALHSRSGGAARSLPAGGTMLWNDGTWLRLNQNLDFSKPIFGVHTPGLFAPGSLNVGGLNAWNDPGSGNVWISGNAGIGTSSLAERLVVRGNILLGANNDLFALGALQNLRVVVGRVSSGGARVSGDGFSSARSGEGSYTISFSPAFSSTPVVVATAVNPSGEDNLVSVNSMSVLSFQLVAFDVATVGEDTRQDTEFTFIALGAP